MSSASELSRRLAERAEAVCRAYLPNGRRSGGYWFVGDVSGVKGRSLFVRLWGEAAGHWTDAATSQYGDLLDLIRLNRNLNGCREALEEARHFLNLPDKTWRPAPKHGQRDRTSAARKLCALSHPVAGTLAETYLRGRAITARLDWPSLRFHPACYYRADDNAPVETWPALIGVVTGLDGAITGLQRTWLARDGRDKAPLLDPRRSMGHLLGNAVRFGEPRDLMAAGEASNRAVPLSLFPGLPMAAGLSAGHLAAIRFPPGLRRLYVLRDNDAAGDFVEERLGKRCADAGLDFRVLRPSAKDLNADLRASPAQAVTLRMLAQMAPEDGFRFAR